MFIKIQETMPKKSQKNIDFTRNQQDVYSWQKDLPTKVREKVLEERRQELLDLLPAIPDPSDETCYRLIKEWIALVEERNKVLRQRIIEEDQRHFNDHIKEMYTILQKIGLLDKSVGHTLRKTLATTYKCVKEYCTKKGVDLESSKKIEKDNSAAVQVVVPLPPALPPLPKIAVVPPPPVASIEPVSPEAFVPTTKTPTTRSTKSQKNFSGRRKSKKSSRPGTPRPKMDAKTPHQIFKDDLQARLSTGRRNLRATPVVRSPGGTPAKKPRRLSPSDPADLMAIALRRKFKKAMRHSPNASIENADNSVNISID